MHTEDDTFAALRRTPFVDMVSIISNALRRRRRAGDYLDVDELCKSHGWTFREFLDKKRSSAGQEGLIIKTVNPYKAPRDKILTKFKP